MFFLNFSISASILTYSPLTLYLEGSVVKLDNSMFLLLMSIYELYSSENI